MTTGTPLPGSIFASACSEAGPSALSTRAILNHGSKGITEGYQNIALDLKDGTSKVGRYLGEDDQVVRIEIAEDDKIIEVASISKGDIASRRESGTGMTLGLAEKMSKRDMRDLIAFLAEQRKKK